MKVRQTYLHTRSTHEGGGRHTIAGSVNMKQEAVRNNLKRMGPDTNKQYLYIYSNVLTIIRCVNNNMNGVLSLLPHFIRSIKTYVRSQSLHPPVILNKKPLLFCLYPHKLTPVNTNIHIKGIKIQNRQFRSNCE